jgi:hypothetical protein
MQFHTESKIVGRTKDTLNFFGFFIQSYLMCLLLCFQIFYTNQLVEIEDWSAFMDTTGTMAFEVAVLLIVTLILNAITLIVNRIRIVK